MVRCRQFLHSVDVRIVQVQHGGDAKEHFLPRCGGDAGVRVDAMDSSLQRRPVAVAETPKLCQYKLGMRCRLPIQAEESLPEGRAQSEDAPNVALTPI